MPKKKKLFHLTVCCLPEINSKTLRNSYIFCATFSVVIFNASIWFLFTFFSLSLEYFCHLLFFFPLYCNTYMPFDVTHFEMEWMWAYVVYLCVKWKKKEKRNIWKFCLILANALRDLILSIKIRFPLKYHLPRCHGRIVQCRREWKRRLKIKSSETISNISSKFNFWQWQRPQQKKAVDEKTENKNNLQIFILKREEKNACLLSLERIELPKNETQCRCCCLFCFL